MPNERRVTAGGIIMSIAVTFYLVVTLMLLSAAGSVIRRIFG